MGEFVGAVILIVVAWIVIKALASGAREGYSGQGAQSPRNGSRSSSQVTLDANMAWLRERWRAADQAKATGELGPFPKWYFDPVTDRQRARLEKMGVRVSGGDLSKGAASDIIGLFEPWDDFDESVLRFFKVDLPKELQNETRARDEVRKLLSDPTKAEAWANRPAEPMQKEFFRHFGMKIPSGLSYRAAEKAINEASESKSDAELDSWRAYEDLCAELADPEFLRDAGLKKPSFAVIRAAVEEIKKTGEGADATDPFDVADKILEMKPELERA